MLAAQILKYDPLVSDTACHTRACYLIHLSRKSKTTGLSADEENYLEACDLLTQTQNRTLDVFGIITDERTDLSKIPAKYLLSAASNNKKNTLLAQKKKEVAQTTLRFLQQSCAALALEEDPALFTFNIPTYRQRIPVLPLYVSAKMMLHYAAKQTVPLVVNLKRLRLEDRNFVLDGAASLVYDFNSETGKFLPQEKKEDEAVIALDLVSCHVKGTETEVNGFLASQTFQAFMEAFQKEDLAALVMICAVGHPPYPPTAEPPKLARPAALPIKEAAPEARLAQAVKPEVPALAETEVKPPSIAALQVSLSECSEKEFKQLSSLARQYGFFRPQAQYVALDRKNGKLTRTNSCLPLFIDHVRASTLRDCQAATARLLEQRAELKAAQEEAFATEQPKRETR